MKWTAPSWWVAGRLGDALAGTARVGAGPLKRSAAGVASGKRDRLVGWPLPSSATAHGSPSRGSIGVLARQGVLFRQRAISSA